LNRDRLANVRMVVMAAPRKKFEQPEIVALKEYMQQVIQQRTRLDRVTLDDQHEC
jgi:hypothetical protein